MSQLRTWIIAGLIIILWSFVLSWLDASDRKTFGNQQYLKGVLAGQKLQQLIVKNTGDPTQICLKWWAGSQDMRVVRRDLCSSYRESMK